MTDQRAEIAIAQAAAVAAQDAARHKANGTKHKARATGGELTTALGVGVVLIATLVISIWAQR